MSDEQTRLLQQILDTQREHLAFAKQQREEFAAMQKTALAVQGKSVRMSRIALWVLFTLLGLVAAVAIVGSNAEREKNLRAPVPAGQAGEK
jgi:hypothetical protein